MRQLLRESAPDIIAIDGKTSRRTHARKTGREPLHLVSAWASRQRLVLGQEAVCDKSNEIVAIPLLLERLALTGALVTIDAMGTQRAIAEAKRHGITTLFAALNVLDGKMIGRCLQQHRHEEFIHFLTDVERAVPPGMLVEAIEHHDAVALVELRWEKLTTLLPALSSKDFRSQIWTPGWLMGMAVREDEHER